MRAIPFDNSQSYDPLWNSLAAWAERARAMSTAGMLSCSVPRPQTRCIGPACARSNRPCTLDPEGTRRVSIAETPLPASWLLALDPRQRFDKPGPIDPYGENSERIDPYESLALDIDITAAACR